MRSQLRVTRELLAARRRWLELRDQNLAAYQEQRARHLLTYVRDHAPFYRQHWRGHDLADWRNLPTVDKQAMVEHFTEFNTQGVSFDQALKVALAAEQSRDFNPKLGNLTVGLSSGTSGQRGLFLVSPAEQAAWAGVILARVLHHWPWRSIWRGGLRVAFFLRSNSNLYQQARSSVIRFRYFDLGQSLEQAVAALNLFQPEILIAPPLWLSRLAERQAADLHITPQRLISVADVLEDCDRERCQAAFQRPVEQIYQSTEGLLAITCPQGALHVQEDVVYIQWQALDEAQTLPVRARRVTHRTRSSQIRPTSICTRQQPPMRPSRPTVRSTIATSRR